MSYAIAVWEGEIPGSDDEATHMFEALYEASQLDDAAPPTPRIRSYVEAMLWEWPEDDPSSPWSDGPVMRNAIGPLFVFAVSWSKAEYALPRAAAVARERGLACYDAEQCRLP